MATLRVPMTINGVSYAAGDTPTSEHADLIRNPDAWTGGTVPALTRRGGVFSVASFPLAVPDNATDSTAAVKAAVEMARAYGGMVEFPGKYVVSDTITMYDGMGWRGLGPGISGLRMATGVNKDLVKTDLFDTLNPGSTTGGPKNWSITGMTLDGNQAGNPTAGYVLSIYGANFQIDRVHITGGRSGGVRSRWGTGGTNMESHWSNFKVYNNGGVQFDHQGPHDTVFVNGQVFMDGSQTPAVGRYGVRVSGNATGEQFMNMHIWGFHEVGWYIQQGNVKMLNAVAEGAKINVWLDASDCIWNGDTFGTSGAGPYAGTEVGVRIGTNPAATKWGNRVRGISSRWAAGDFPLDFVADNGTDVDLTGRIGSATAMYTGTPHYKTLARMHLLVSDSPQFSQAAAFYGTGLPNNSLGVVGSYYHRSDGTTGSRIYHKTAAATWTATAA